MPHLSFFRLRPLNGCFQNFFYGLSLLWRWNPVASSKMRNVTGVNFGELGELHHRNFFEVHGIRERHFFLLRILLNIDNTLSLSANRVKLNRRYHCAFWVY